ncbi:TRAP-type C4-dicarboxylate transport system permease small subunit [Sphingomonas kaistensis]|uniref:TRAP transporter small permease protein n=1 Tax=Sphingomonas kaistensis TaxID=298708 RepID=A0A7X5Y3A5_9SPHN|nr:TRAP-type C4-dicarboxylate transport system permease small subunit [Sphingomonas kaistensis]
MAEEMATSTDSSDGDAPAPVTGGPVARIAFVVGCCGLLLATAADSIAVLGRHAGFQLLGAIEVVQAAIVLIAASSLVSVTLARGHAGVHILTERLKPEPRRRLAIAADIAASLTVLVLVIGSTMILADLWNGFERSELLHIPLRLLRLLMTLALVVVAIAFLRQAWRAWRRHDA